MQIIFFLLGLIIGSFLNAVIYRLNTLESLLERSHCPHCKKTIRWFDNIPVLSFIILSACCRDCGEKISWQYPIVELTTGVIFALVARYFFLAPYNLATWLQTIYFLIVFSLLLIIFVYDFKYMEIPMLVLWAGVVLSLVYFLYYDAQLNGAANAISILQLKTVSGLLGGLVSFAFFFALAAYSKETWMGYGDAYLGLLAGLVVGWPSILPALTLSFAIGAFVSVILISVKKKTMKSQVPFAPFLISGIFLTVFLPQIFPVLKYFLSF